MKTPLATLAAILPGALCFHDPVQTVDFGDGPQPATLRLDTRHVKNALLYPLPTGDALLIVGRLAADSPAYLVPASLTDAVRRVLNLQAVTA